MNDIDNLQDRVIAVVASVLKCAADAGTSRENTPQWDSLKHVELVFTIEDELGLQFSEEQLAGLNSVAALVAAAEAGCAA